MTLTEHLTRIVTLLRAAIGAQLTRQLCPPQPVMLGHVMYFPRPPRHPNLPQPVWTLLYLRLGRLLRRIQVLHDAWRSGTLPAPRALRAPRPRTACPGRPFRHAWYAPSHPRSPGSAHGRPPADRPPRRHRL